MIQPINTVAPMVRFREAKKGNNRKFNNSDIAIMNAGGVAAAVGGITTLVTRSYTKSFTQAGVLGVFGAFLAVFFMTPHVVNTIARNKMAQAPNNIVANEGVAQKSIKKPFRKLVAFKAEQV